MKAAWDTAMLGLGILGTMLAVAALFPELALAGAVGLAAAIVTGTAVGLDLGMIAYEQTVTGSSGTSLFLDSAGVLATVTDSTPLGLWASAAGNGASLANASQNNQTLQNFWSSRSP
jgi:hypothetical protein